VERIGQEHQYFEYVNTLRLLSRELFTRINPKSPAAAHRIDQVLQEMRNRLLYFNHEFTSRFLNDELRNADFYEEGSALRHLATVKELFATHIALYWMAVKHAHGGSHKGSHLGDDERMKVEFIRTTVKSLVSCKPFLEQVAQIASEIASQDRVQGYSPVDLQSALDTFETDNSPAADVAKLQRIQKLYLLVHKYFMQKAGNYDYPFEIAQQDGASGYLFSEDVKKVPGGADIDSVIIKEGAIAQKGANLSAKKDGRKDFLQIAQGEDRGDNADFHSDDSQARINMEEENQLLKDDAEEDFAYLKHQLQQVVAPRDWRLELSSDALKIFRKINHNHHAHWAQIALKCQAHLDHIPKHIVYKALSEINLRAKWDKGIGEIDLLEHNKEKDLTYFRLHLKVPHHMLSREAVLVRKVLKDFPQVHHFSIVQRSVNHPRVPENHKQSTRVETRMDGFIIEDDESQKGTTLNWFLSTDLKGSLPNSMLIECYVRYQATLVAELIKACHQIVKGQLK
jgi:hypothetical protein